MPMNSIPNAELSLYCLPCLLRQAVSLAQEHVSTREGQCFLVKQILTQMAEFDHYSCAPLIARSIHRAIREFCANDDPYRDLKNWSNMFVLNREREFRAILNRADDPMYTALKLAASGNVIDFGPTSTLDGDEVFRVVQGTLQKDLSMETFEQLKKELSCANILLYIGDNAGEIVFDKLLIETIRANYPCVEVYFATRGSAVINDAIEHDAVAVGMDDLAKVINNGTDIPGTVLTECSAEFLRIFERADVIIAKGQGNFESLVDQRRHVYFIFLCKCDVFEKKVGARRHDIVFQCR